MNNKYHLRSFVPYIVLTILLLVSLACGRSAKDTSPELVATAPIPVATNPPIEQPTALPTQAALVEHENNIIGDMITLGDLVFVVVGWDNVPPTDFSKPDAGNRLIAVDTIIVNNSAEPIAISTFLMMSVKDDAGQEYGMDFTAMIAIDEGTVDGELSSGEKVRAKTGFQVPENAQDLQFVFDTSIYGSGNAIVELGSEPIAVEPPNAIPGETPQQTYKVGDVIALGTTTIIVNQITYPTGDKYSKPDPGTKFLVIDLTLDNQDAKPITVSCLLQTSVKDGTGQKYRLNIPASLLGGGSLPDGEITPSEKLQGQVGFQVPENATGLVFVYDADVSGTGKVFVSIP